MLIADRLRYPVTIACIFTDKGHTDFLQIRAFTDKGPIIFTAKGLTGDNWSYKTCKKAPVKSSPPTNQHPSFFWTSCRPTNSVGAPKEKHNKIYNMITHYNSSLRLPTPSGTLESGGSSAACRRRPHWNC